MGSVGWPMIVAHDAPLGAHWSRGAMSVYEESTGQYHPLWADTCPDWLKRSVARSDTLVRAGGQTEWDVSLFRSLKDTAPLAKRWAWPKIVELLSRYRTVLAKQDLPLWSAASWPGGASSCKAVDVEAVGMLVLDYDSGAVTIEQAARRWGRWQSLIHTSASHTPDKPKFRVVVPLARPIAPADWARAWRWASGWCKGVDGSAKDIGRRYFLPGGSAPEHWRLLVLDRRPLLHLAVERLPEEPAPARPVVPRPLPGAVRWDEGMRELADRLKHDSALRESLGIKLGGQVAAGTVRGIRCPQCGDASVWWPLVPNGTPQAMCNHRNSCAWMGWLDTLAQGAT